MNHNQRSRENIKYINFISIKKYLETDVVPSHQSGSSAWYSFNNLWVFEAKGLFEPLKYSMNIEK